jgi:DNA-binding transcriptional LysR family regulator
MEHRQILNFLAVCGERNFTRAAEQRHITQQGLSKSIRDLERELGAPLFERNRRQAVVLTECGRVLEGAARAWTGQHDYIADTLRAMAENSRFRLSVGITDSLLSLLPRRFVGGFVEAHPEISLFLKTFTWDTCQKNVAEQKLQVGFAVAPIDQELFRAIPVGGGPLRIAVGKRHPLARRKSIQFAELATVNLISLANYIPLKKLAAERGFVRNIEPAVELSFVDLVFIGELLETGRYASFCGAGTEGYGENKNDIVLLDIEDAELPVENYLIVNRHTFINQAAEAFIEYAKERFAG